MDASAIKTEDSPPPGVPAFVHPYKTTDRITPPDAPSATSIPTFLNLDKPRPDSADRAKPAAKNDAPDHPSASAILTRRVSIHASLVNGVHSSLTETASPDPGLP